MNRVISVFNKKTSMRLTNTEWNILETICLQEKIKRKTLLEYIENKHSAELNLTSAVRLFSQIYLYHKLFHTDLKKSEQNILQRVLEQIK